VLAQAGCIALLEGPLYGVRVTSCPHGCYVVYPDVTTGRHADNARSYVVRDRYAEQKRMHWQAALLLAARWQAACGRHRDAA
jgi:hypothetical protein